MKDQKVENPKKALIAIADTHGHLDILQKLLERLKIPMQNMIWFYG